MATELRPAFAVLVSSEEVARGKPSPDVYLEAARRLGLDPLAGAAVEDSSNGILAAADAGLSVIAIPNRVYPPKPDALARCAMIAASPAGVSQFLLTRLPAPRPAVPAAPAS